MKDETKEYLFIAVVCISSFVVGAALGNVVPINPQPKKQPIIIH